MKNCINTRQTAVFEVVQHRDIPGKSLVVVAMTKAYKIEHANVLIGREIYYLNECPVAKY
jgi:hypothetical protein